MSDSQEYSGIDAISMAILRSSIHDDPAIVVDNDSAFAIDTKTRVVSNRSGKKELVKGDHNSERLTFEMDRYIEGHDMLTCNAIRLHYLNVNNPGIYDVVDISAKSDDDTKVIFTWIITSNVTRDVGKISFAIKFQCVQDSGEITYKWSTKINDELSCVDSIDNSKHVVEHNVDVLEQWKQDLFGVGDSVLSDINAAKNEAMQSIDEVLQTIPEDYTVMQNNITELKGDLNELKEQGIGGSGIPQAQKTNFANAIRNEIAFTSTSHPYADAFLSWLESGSDTPVTPPTPEEPDEPTEPTLTGITVVWSATSADVGTDPKTLISSVKSNYSDGTSQTVTGYTVTPSALVEGSNIVTVTYQSKSATETIAGNAVVVNDVADGLNVEILEENKYITATGTESTYNGWFVSKYIDVSGKSDITISNSSATNFALQYCGFYDENKTWKSKISTLTVNASLGGKTIPVPSGIKYVKLSADKALVNTISLE